MESVIHRGMTRYALIFVIALTAALAARACFGGPGEMKAEGGGWYTTFHSFFPESGGNTKLFRKRGLLDRVEIAELVYVMRVYPSSDCILFETSSLPYNIYAACGNHTPVSVASTARWSYGHWRADDNGLVRADSLRVTNGRVGARTERMTLHDIETAARSQPAFEKGRAFASAELPIVETNERPSPEQPGVNGTTPLMQAAMLGQLDVVDQLIAEGANVNAKNENGWTILQNTVGVWQPNPAVVQHLIDAGAKLDPVTSTGTTPLMRAAINKDTAIFRILLAAGANPCLREEDGETIVDNAGNVYPNLTAMAQQAYARCPATSVPHVKRSRR